MNFNALTIDSEIITLNTNQAGVFKETFRLQHVDEPFEPPSTVLLLDPVTYRVLENEEIMQADIMYLIIVISDTLLHDAVQKQYSKLVDFLITIGMDVDAVDDDERTALSYACDADIASLLISAGADVNHQDIEDKTAMHRLLEELVKEMTTMSNVERLHSIVRTLHVLSWNGADPDLENEEDVSCRELYHAVFPEEQLGDEDQELRQFFASSSSSSSSYDTYDTYDEKDDMM